MISRHVNGQGARPMRRWTMDVAGNEADDQRVDVVEGGKVGNMFLLFK
jgi:hypothetical protein